MTSLALKRVFSQPARPAQAAPASTDTRNASTIRTGMATGTYSATTIEQIEPMINWPWAPIFQSCARNATETPSAIMSVGISFTNSSVIFCVLPKEPLSIMP